MKKLLYVLLLTIILLPVINIPIGYTNSIVRVQGNCRSTVLSGGKVTVTMDSTPITGNLLIACISQRGSGGIPFVDHITQTGGTWTLQKFVGYGGESCEIWAGVMGSGASVTVEVYVDLAYDYRCTVNICEYSGLLTDGFLDVTASDYLDYKSYYAPDTGTTSETSQDLELWIGCIFVKGDTLSNPTNGFTLLDGVPNSDNTCGYLEKIVSSTGTANTGCTASGTAMWDACIATFKGDVSIPVIPPTTTITDSMVYIGIIFIGISIVGVLIRLPLIPIASLVCSLIALQPDMNVNPISQYFVFLVMVCHIIMTLLSYARTRG